MPLPLGQRDKAREEVPGTHPWVSSMELSHHRRYVSLCPGKQNPGPLTLGYPHFGITSDAMV